MKVHPCFFLVTLCFIGLKPAEGSSNPDTTKIIRSIDSLNKLCDNLLDTSADWFHQYGAKALQLSSQIKYQPGIAKSLMSLYQYYYFKRKYITAINLLITSATISKGIKDYKGAGAAYERVGYLYAYLQQFDLAKNYISQSQEYAWATHDTNTLILSFLDQGLLEQGKANFRKALAKYRYAYFLADKQGTTKLAARAMKLIGNCYVDTQEYNKALFYYIEALKIVLKNGHKLEVGSLYTYIAHVHQVRQEFRSAVYYNRLAGRIRKDLHQYDQYVSSLFNLGNDFLLMGQLDSSMHYVQLGLQLIPPGELFKYQSYGCSLLYSLYLKKGLYKEAFEYFRKYSVAKDSSDKERNQETAAIIQSKDYIQEINRRNSILSYENQLQKLEIINKNRTTFFFLILFLVTIGFVGGLYWLYIRTKRSKEVLASLNRQLDGEIRERKVAEANLAKSEQSYRFLAENTLDVILLLNEKARITYISPTCEKMFGYTAYELRNRFRPLNMMDPEFHSVTVDMYREMVDTREPGLFTFIGIRKDHTTFWAECVTNPIFEPGTDQFRGSLTVVRDISERIKYEEQLAENARQKELLLREIHHRVKNNFAILIGVMNLQKTSTKNSEMHLLIGELQRRVRTMSLVHELLYRSDNLDFIPFGTYLTQLSNIVASTFRSKRVLVKQDVDQCTLNINVALPLGLVVNELLTNSFKYAFGEQEEGQIQISLKPHTLDASGLPRTWELIIRDNGKGLPDSFSLDSITTLGSQIVKLLVAQVEGTIEVSNDHGAVFRIIFNQESD